MNRFIRYFNQNRIRIIITILIVAFIVLIIQLINYILKQNVPESIQADTDIVDTSVPKESVITGDELAEEVTEANVNIIDQFVAECNNQDYNSAYNLLSQACKEELYNSIDIFISNYYNIIFSNKKSYNLELWYNTLNSYTYKITYQDNNMLATGNANSLNNIEDYITVINENGEIRLNINSFIGKETIDKSQTSDKANITIKINDRYIYKDYEKYNITVTNNTNKSIKLCEGIDSNEICVVDTNEVEYNSILNEIPLINLELAPGMEKTIDIKFYKMYNLYRTIEKISFKRIILNPTSDIQKNNLETISIEVNI